MHQEVKREEQTEAQVEEPQQEQVSEAVSANEPTQEEAAEEPVGIEERVVNAGDGKTSFRIIEENNRIVVLQVDCSSTTSSSAK
jgi:hypothetical protein